MYIPFEEAWKPGNYVCVSPVVVEITSSHSVVAHSLPLYMLFYRDHNSGRARYEFIFVFGTTKKTSFLERSTP